MKIETFSMDYYDNVINVWKRAGISLGSSDDRETVLQMLEKNPSLFLIGKFDEKIVSVVAGTFDGRRGYVHHLAVDPDYQRSGFGKILMDELFSRFRIMGVYKVHLFVEKDNKSVIKFYQALGWKKRDDLIMMSKYPIE